MPRQNTPSEQNQVYVWDPFVRILHWSLVAAFTNAYLVEKPLTVHVWPGYAVGILVASRANWVSSALAMRSFSDFIYSPAVSLRSATSRPGHGRQGGAA
jgi:cytochrome b